MMNASITGWWQVIYSVYLVSGGGFSRAGLSRSGEVFQKGRHRLLGPPVQFWLVFSGGSIFKKV